MRAWLTMISAIGVVAFAALALATHAGPAPDPKPSEGWGLHIDAKLHVPGKPEMVSHHYCKAVSGGLTQCQLYDSDKPDARLIGVEVVVSPEMYKSFSKAEKAMWHYHKTEIPRVSATLPDLPAEEAAKVAKNLEESYGKVYILWDPAKGNFPTGRPIISRLK